MRPPKRMSWLFWDVDLENINVHRDESYVLARVLEHGTLIDVEWAIKTYGLERIHRFFREVGHPDLSEATLSFWRATFKAGEEKWAEPPRWRKASGVPWHG
jgi:hypothetical protein